MLRDNYAIGLSLPPGGTTMECVHFQPEQSFSDLFARKPFLFSHNLNGNELFSMQSVEKLAEMWSRDAGKSGFFVLDEQIKIWGSEEHKTGMVDAFRNAEISRMRMKLSFIHKQPEYEELLRTCTSELTQLTGVDLAGGFRSPLATLFISSPREFTHFHIDSEDNFLLQLAGTKTVYVFDGKDREIIDWPDIENYWFDKNSRIFREEIKSRGVPYELTPGTGIHIPVHFPHMVANGPTSSMSLSIAYAPPEAQHHVLRANYHLRKLGLNPAPPGQSKVADTAKSAAVSGARSLKNTIKRLRSK